MGEKCREILMLAAEEMSMQDMLRVTGLNSLGTVLSRLSNCRKELKEKLSYA
jgi:DNA-directed RNA polymerase specialized sigma24 family protein